VVVALDHADDTPGGNEITGEPALLASTSRHWLNAAS
jgi:hypothetical protein